MRDSQNFKTPLLQVYLVWVEHFGGLVFQSGQQMSLSEVAEFTVSFWI